MKIALPQEISDARLDTLLLVFNKIQQNQTLILDFSNTKTILPAGHAILNCLIDKAVEHRCQIQLQAASHELQKLRIFQNLQTLIPRSTFPSSDELAYFDDELILQGAQESINPGFLDHLENQFRNKINEEQLWFMRLIFNELMQNTQDHSTAERYMMYAGTIEEEVHFGVLDLGVSIPAKLEQKYNCKDDITYLHKSVQFEVGTRRMHPGGLGLYHMFEILKHQEGRLVIVSRYAQVRKYFKTRKSSSSLLKHPLRGTWCFARMPLEKIK